MRTSPGYRLHAELRRARRDHANKEWLEAQTDEHRSMQMIGGALALLVLALLGALIGFAGAEWWTDAGLIVDLVASWRTAP